MRDWESAIDRQIRKAMEEGEFANLPGEGKPLDLGDDPNTPADMQMAFKILRENNLAPDWILYGKELEGKREQWLENLKWAFRVFQEAIQDPQRYSRAEANWKRAQQKLGEDAARLNREITTYNLKLPQGITHRPLLNLEREIRQLTG
jgi:DnaJ homolog subfamily C member 28